MATNITGCGPALLACFCLALENSSKLRAHTMEPCEIAALITETLSATGRLVEGGHDYAAIMREAATGGGMTQVAMEELHQSLPGLLERALRAIDRRQQELQGSDIGVRRHL
jgi:pyrroline-5-carboxylate reductase